MPFSIIRDDITRVRADVIVNTANPHPVYGRGTDHAVYMAAGAEKLLAERKKIGEIAVGEAAVTPAFDLPARYIIHTVGPVWRGGTENEFALLASCYRKSLLLAKQLGAASIATPLISAGNYRFPKAEALDIALREIKSFLEDEEDIIVTLVVFDKRVYELSSELEEGVTAYIDEKTAGLIYEAEYDNDESLGSVMMNAPSYNMPFEDAMPSAGAAPAAGSAPKAEAAPKAKKKKLFLPSLPAGRRKKRKLDELERNLGESFQECLFRHIYEQGLTNAEVYKKANIDRKLFSKIQKNKDYHPKKQTALAFAFALELNPDETRDLIGRAGYALSDSNMFDLIIEYCLEKGIYDLFTVNAILFDRDQMLLG